MKPAVVLLSGGLDSATCLAIARSQGFACYCLSFDYGQRHSVELKAAEQVAKVLGASEHRILSLALAQFGGSALTDTRIAIPISGVQPGIPVTYVPARNTIMLSLALAWAEVLGSRDIFVGVNAVDYSGYPDCRPDYIAAFEKMANLATRAGVEGIKLDDSRAADRSFQGRDHPQGNRSSASITASPSPAIRPTPKALPVAPAIPAACAPKVSPPPASPTPRVTVPDHGSR